MNHILRARYLHRRLINNVYRRARNGHNMMSWDVQRAQTRYLISFFPPAYTIKYTYTNRAIWFLIKLSRAQSLVRLLAARMQLACNNRRSALLSCLPLQCLLITGRVAIISRAYKTYLQRNRTGVIFVEDLKDSFGEKRLKNKIEIVSIQLKNSLHILSSWRTFFDVTIFLKSSRLISFSLPTVLRNSCSKRSSDILSKPVLGRAFVKFDINSIIWLVDTWFVPSMSISRNSLSRIPLAFQIWRNLSGSMGSSPHKTYATDSSCSAKSIWRSWLQERHSSKSKF